MTYNYSIYNFTDLALGTHVCCIYETEYEYRYILTQYLSHGLAKNEKVIYILDTHAGKTLLGYLQYERTKVDHYLSTGQLSILEIDDAYMRDGVFSPDSIISLLESKTKQALEEGYSGLRVTVEMAWTLRELPNFERLIEYEGKINSFFTTSKCMAMCLYDRKGFSPEILVDIIKTHPIVAIGMEIYENIYYVAQHRILDSGVHEATLSHWIDNLRKRKKAEQSARDTELRYTELFNSAREPILATMNSLAIELASLPSNVSIQKFIVKRLKDLTGAVAVGFSDYDPTSRMLMTSHLEIQQGIFKKVVRLLGKRLKDVSSPVSEEMYHEIISSVVGKRDTLTEVTFGAIPYFVSAAIQKLIGVDRFIGIAYVIEGELYGTSLLAIKAGMPDPSFELLESFANMSAVSLRQRRAEEALKHQLEVEERMTKELELKTKELSLSNEELNSFVYIVSHDLKAPLVSIQGFSTILSKDYKDKFDDNGKIYVDRIMKNSERMGMLIDNLLELSRIGRIKGKEGTINISDMISEISEEISSQMKEKGTKLIVKGEMPTISGDQTRVKQIFANLISNANKFMGDDNEVPTIEVGYDSQNGCHRFYVKDNGIGIDKQYHDKVFQIFQRLDDIKTEGTGVGLAIVKKIVESFGGNIWLDSEKGKGTIIYFTIPKENNLESKKED